MGIFSEVQEYTVKGTKPLSKRESEDALDRIKQTIKDKYAGVAKNFTSQKTGPIETDWEKGKSDEKYLLTVSFVVTEDKNKQKAEELRSYVAGIIGAQKAGPVETVWEKESKPKAVASKTGKGPTFGTKEW